METRSPLFLDCRRKLRRVHDVSRLPLFLDCRQKCTGITAGARPLLALARHRHPHMQSSLAGWLGENRPPCRCSHACWLALNLSPEPRQPRAARPAARQPRTAGPKARGGRAQLRAVAPGSGAGPAVANGRQHWDILGARLLAKAARSLGLGSTIATWRPAPPPRRGPSKLPRRWG